jgi:hypothetical protein
MACSLLRGRSLLKSNAWSEVFELKHKRISFHLVSCLSDLAGLQTSEVLETSEVLRIPTSLDLVVEALGIQQNRSLTQRGIRAESVACKATEVLLIFVVLDAVCIRTIGDRKAQQFEDAAGVTPGSGQRETVK